MPPAEAILWSKLNGRKLLGIKFRRQYGVESYRLDFFSSELQLGIELDGETHTVRDGPDRDARRDQYVESLGIRIIRIWNNEVYDNLDGVWDALVRAAQEQMKKFGVEDARGRRLRRTNESRDRRRKAGE